MNFVADRINRIKPSMTVGINIKAKAMKEEGKDVIVLAAENQILILLKIYEMQQIKQWMRVKQNMFLVKELLNYKKLYKKNFKETITSIIV